VAAYVLQRPHVRTRDRGVGGLDHVGDHPAQKLADEDAPVELAQALEEYARLFDPYGR